MDWTIVTPSYGQLPRLACCIASIADQAGVQVEHIVQDGGTVGFVEFAKEMEKKWPDRPGYRRVMISEKDQGMYDAINRGLARARGSLCAYLNCDEQYLPDTLKKVADAFAAHPFVDLFFGDALVLDETGSARCWRKVLVPMVAHTWTCHFSAFTAAMFFRRRVVEAGMLFDASYRAAADAAWYLQVRRWGAHAAALGFFTSAFGETGENLGLGKTALEERQRLTRLAPTRIRRLRWVWMLVHRFRRLLAGGLCRQSVRYAVFIPGKNGRVEFYAPSLRATWPGRMWGL